ncbi:hypothetical protein HGA88_06790 [Candidatus Roizmanbacteria bacterium]|nr:hypothetical protein [Candidatus Roizmanbacteria bacterium]
MTTTKSVWQFRKGQAEEWKKNHRGDTILNKKFYSFEQSVTENPYLSNPDVKPMKGKIKDVTEYKKGDVRGLYQIDESNTELDLITFDWKGNIKNNYKK